MKPLFRIQIFFSSHSFSLMKQYPLYVLVSKGAEDVEKMTKGEMDAIS